MIGINLDKFQIVINDYKQDKIKEKELVSHFEKLINLFCKELKVNLDKELNEDLVDICLQKLERYDSKKGKAFNYFTTIILCHLRQINRKRRITV